MKFIPRQMSWYKRRRPTEADNYKEIEHVDVVNFKKSNNYPCVMHIYYKDDPDMLALTARVHKNDLAKPARWTVQGLNHQGISVVVDVVED